MKMLSLTKAIDFYLSHSPFIRLCLKIQREKPPLVGALRQKSSSSRPAD